MKLKSINIINFRGIKNVNIEFNEMVNFLVSNNNVGKTRILECINQFYQGTKENMEAEFVYTISEEDKKIINETIKELADNKLESELKVLFKNNEYFYKDIKVKKLIDNKVLGEVIYIPAVSDHDNETDISKTTTSLSKIITKILNKNEQILKNLDSLNQDLHDYISLIKNEAKYNLNKMDKEILFDNIKLELSDKQFENSQIIKNNLKLKVLEDNDEKDISELGTGVQRSIVNSIIMFGLDSNYYTILLYDEPETFLNIGLQRKLMQEINNNKKNTQYVIATHSPDIIYRNEDIFSSIIKLHKKTLNNIDVKQFDQNNYIDIVKKYNLQLAGIDAEYLIKENIKKTILAWWDRNRINALFEDKILIVEGPTEEIFIDMICKEKNIAYISTASGKYSMPYFKILFNDLFGIEIIAMFDKDDEANINHKIVNSFIRNNMKTIELDTDFETYLGYKVNNNRRKPQEFLEQYFQGNINGEKIEELKKKIYNKFFY